MNSLSDVRSGDGESAVASDALLGGVPRKREVLRLQFHTLGQSEGPGEEKIGEVATESELRLREEITALQSKLAAQAEAASVEVEGAKRDAVESAEDEWRRGMEARIEQERAKIAQALERFREERTKYFAGVEAEVVKLSLAVAARVLHRETKLDPLLLTAAVRVSLEKVAEQSEVVLRVPAEDATAWNEALGETAGVELIGDQAMQAGECVVETKVGNVDLGVSAQLIEIERGFFDLLQQRPA
ncbi:hypothetical protein GCM10011507_04570 [Edaphobacter acidisoli]|uniref:Flagellar assembly protein FliH n=1 Tax=Edaphobacter acidisoli TaxID=2040573 RepID=A0A916RH15_9BACT|nr:FliH/SctL family protein [Edaphobacter acidisoli]GGA56336.1 hypothetical protein GCM10011507_04570 [Edaphobacter acidisoli]